MEKSFYTLKEASELLGWDYERIKTMARRGKIPVIDIPYGSQRLKKGISKEALTELQQYGAKDKYQVMLDIYIYEMQAGVWDGKGRALTDNWIGTLSTSLERYWKILGVNPTISGVSASNFKTVMASFKIDRENKRDYYSTKMHIYKAVCGLMKILIREGYKTKADLEAIREFRPGKVFELKKDFLDYEDVLAALEKNATWINGRSKYDRLSMEVLISLYAYGGLRREEAIYLRLEQVNMAKGYMHVYGKWAIERIVPTFPVLRECLEKWLAYRQVKGIDSPLVLTQSDGTQLTKKAIDNRFQRFRAHAKITTLSPHNLRRSCATIASVHGMPDGLIQRMLGHKHASTTEKYKMVQDRHLVEYAQTFNFGQVKPPEAEAIEQVFTLPAQPLAVATTGNREAEFW